MGISKDYPQINIRVYLCVAALLKSGNIHCFLKRPQKKQPEVAKPEKAA